MHIVFMTFVFAVAVRKTPATLQRRVKTIGPSCEISDITITTANMRFQQTRRQAPHTDSHAVYVVDIM